MGGYKHMRRISFTMYPDDFGRITVINTIKYIIENVKEINIPDVDINTIPLAALTLKEDKTKYCIDAYAEGKMWIGGKCTEYEFNLIFA